MSYRVYICGFGDRALNDEEFKKLDEHKSNWSDGWSKDAYKLLDKRNNEFDNVKETFKSDDVVSGGKEIVMFADFEIDEGSEKSKVLEVVNDLKTSFSDFEFKAYGDDGAPL